MGFVDAVKSCLSQYATLSGRAPRSEYWWFSLFSVLVGSAASLLDLIIFGVPENASPFSGYEFSAGPIAIIVSLAFLLPSIAVSVRRLHDRNHSGWWLLLMFIPIIGWIVLFVFFVMKGDTGANRFGPARV